MTAIETKSRPILFSAPMVRAILAGKKSQTRRIVKPQPASGETIWWREDEDWSSWVVGTHETKSYGVLSRSHPITCPYGQSGDTLWVREAWWKIPEPSLRQLRAGADTWPKIAYDADESDIDREQNREFGWLLRPSIFMPRSASRITLGITDVRAERLNEISEADAMAEGVENKASYSALWNEIHGFGSWKDNPWVWAITFEQVKS